MKKLFLGSMNSHKLIINLGLFLFCTLNMMAQTVKGTIKSANGDPLIGAAVVVKGTNNGTVTDANGVFSLDKVPQGSILSVSFVGYVTQEIAASQSNLALILQSNENLDEVVVTGVFDKRTALNSSIAITTLSTVQIDKIAVSSSADLLKNVPGVFVNTSLGEIRSTVYSRGVTTGDNEGSNGYNYVSIQEDGLPVTNALFGNFGPDFFLRVDANTSKLEAVRGGSASITGANAPGGIFNYISKTGGENFGGEVRVKYGLEGNGSNPYYRADFNIGGPLAKNLYYNVGGFYRQSDGPQYPGYSSNFGGQIKGNLLYKYDGGSLKLLVKYLDDHNLTAEGIPTTNYTDLTPAVGFSNTSSVLPAAFSVSANIPTKGNVSYNPSDLWHSKDNSVGLNWEQNFGDGWKFTNNARFATKSMEAFTPLSTVSSIALDNIVTYFILGSLNPGIGQIIPGTYSITQGGKEIMSVLSHSGFDYTVTSNSAPGSALSPNSLFFTPLIYNKNQSNEFVDQFNFNKKISNMTFNIGGFYGYSSIDRVQGSMGVSLNTIQNHPQTVGITLKDPGGKVYQITNPQGIVNVGADQGWGLVKSAQTQLALYFGHTWEINDKLTFDWGLRYESVNIKGYSAPGVVVPVANGGADGNPLTLYDNNTTAEGTHFNYDNTLNYLSYSGALNYKLSDNSALYVRYSNGKKSPTFELYNGLTSDYALKNTVIQAQVIEQYELGFKSRAGNFSSTITPFYSVLSNIPSAVTFTDAKGALYNPPPFFNSTKTVGVEVEGTYKFSDNFNIRGVLTLQSATATAYKYYIHLPTGSATSQTDSIVNNSGNTAANVPNLMANITPEYVNDKFYVDLTWSYMGDRQANVANAFVLPAFSQFNLSTGYNISPKFKLSLNVNNVLNNYGVMGWVGPGTFPNNLNLNGLSAKDIAAAPNAFHQALAIPARAYFLTATYKF